MDTNIERKPGRSRFQSLVSLDETRKSVLPPKISVKKTEVVNLLDSWQVFSKERIALEVDYYFHELGFHTRYFGRFTSEEIASHVHALIAAKKVSQTQNSQYVHVEITDENRGVFMGSSASVPIDGHDTHEMEKKVNRYISKMNNPAFNVVYMRSQNSPGDTFEHPLGLYIVEMSEWNEPIPNGNALNIQGPPVDDSHCHVVDIQSVASKRFLSRKSDEAMRIYAREVSEVLCKQSTVIKVLPPAAFVEGGTPEKQTPADSSNTTPFSKYLSVDSLGGGSREELHSPVPPNRTIDQEAPLSAIDTQWTIQLGVMETDFIGRSYVREIHQCCEYARIAPSRIYLESFSNGVRIYNIYLNADTPEHNLLSFRNCLNYITHFKSTPGRSALAWEMAMSNVISPEECIFILALVKFVFTFFPKETREYLYLCDLLKRDLTSKKYLEDLFLQATANALTMEKIYEVLTSNVSIVKKIFCDFSQIAKGSLKPFLNESILKDIDNLILPEIDLNILKAALSFNEFIRVTNFFKTDSAGALSFRFSGKLLLARPRTVFPEIPYGIYMVMGRGFYGFHVRFRPIARGGIRMIKSRDKLQYNKNCVTLFEENYNLALTQQYKNKDIAEGGSKGTILLDSELSFLGAQDLAVNGRDSFSKYINALLDIMISGSSETTTENHIYSHLGEAEFLFFGPDENTANFMDLGAQIAKIRGYPYWKSLTTGKSVSLGGVPHDVYGITTTGVHEYVLELLKKLGLKEEEVSKVQTGGPDGDLGSNEILISKDKTVCIIDGSGVAWDPQGLDRSELTRLAKERKPIAHFNKAKLSPPVSTDMNEDKYVGAFLVSVDEVDVNLPNGAGWFKTGAQVRDNALLFDFISADLFVPCGGRPASIHQSNVHQLMTTSKIGGQSQLVPKFKYIVEGANLFFTDEARQFLEDKNVHLFKDASANKGGVTSSSLEVFASLCMDNDNHDRLLTVTGDSPAPKFYEDYVKQIIERIKVNARAEFNAIWKANTVSGAPRSPYDSFASNTVTKLQATKALSKKINNLNDYIYAILSKASDSDETITRQVNTVLLKCVPTVILRECSVEEIKSHVPKPYLLSMVSVWIASTYVYRYGLDASEFSFYKFMSDLDRTETVNGNQRLSRSASPDLCMDDVLE